jgi:outer membrane protein assembly factor BamB
MKRSTRSRRSPLFSLWEGDVVVTDMVSGDVLWTGRPLGHPATDVLPLSGGDRAAVLLDFGSMPSGPARNLICLAEDGEIVWQAALPTDSRTDAFVSVDLVRNQIIAHSWTGFRTAIDPKTGKIIDRTFEK